MELISVFSLITVLRLKLFSNEDKVKSPKAIKLNVHNIKETQLIFENYQYNIILSLYKSISRYQIEQGKYFL